MSLIKRIRWSRVLLAVAATGGLWHALLREDESTVTAAPAAENLLVNRPWIDHIPSSERDLVGHLIFIHRDGERFGAVGRSSMWRHTVELFHWSQSKDTIKLIFPQDNRKGSSTVTVSRCKAPEPLNLCLKIGEGQGAVTLYSSSDWKIETTDTTKAFALLPIDPDSAGPDGVLQPRTLFE